MQKNNLIKKFRLGVLTVIILISVLEPVYQYSEELNSNNHAYPVYNVLTLELNNATHDGLQASIKIWNKTSDQWQLNSLLIDTIQENLNNLTDIIEGLAELTVYEYNDTYLPGCLYLLLSPIIFKDSGRVANDTIDYMTNHSLSFWYVANIYYETLDLNTFVSLNYLGIWFIDISTSTWDYTIVNNTLHISYLERDGMEAKIFTFNGTHWLYNWEFLAYYNRTVSYLNSLYFFKNFGVNFGPIDLNNYKNGYEWLNGENYTLTVNNSTPISDIICITNSLYVNLIYDNVSTFDAKVSDYRLRRFFVCLVLITHYWFVYDWVLGYFSGDTGSSSFATLPIIFAGIAVASLLLKKPKRFRKEPIK